MNQHDLEEVLKSDRVRDIWEALRNNHERLFHEELAKDVILAYIEVEISAMKGRLITEALSHLGAQGLDPTDLLRLKRILEGKPAVEPPKLTIVTPTVRVSGIPVSGQSGQLQKATPWEPEVPVIEGLDPSFIKPKKGKPSGKSPKAS